MYLGLLAFVVLVRAMLVQDGSQVLVLLIPWLSSEMAFKAEGAAVYAILVFAPLFFGNLYRYESLTRYVRFFQIEGIVFISVSLLIPLSAFNTFYLITHNLFNLSVLGAIILMFVIVSKALKEKRIGSRYIFYGLISCSVFAIGELMNRSGWFPGFDIVGPNLLNTGILLLFFFQSIALSAIYAHSFKENEQLNRELEEQVSNRTEQLSKSNVIKDRFLKIVSHDLRAPMGNLRAMLDLLASDAITSEQSKKLIGKIEVNLTGSLGLLDDLLEWTKTSAEARLEVYKEQVDIEYLITDTVTFFENLANQKNIELIYRQNEQSELLVESDVNLIKVVLRNLINNSIKFTNIDGRVEVGYKKKKQCVEIFVSDTGIGIPGEMKKSIFDMDSKNKRPGTNNEKSTGVGLALCKDLVRQNGGKIWVEDNSPQGTTFKFTLKLSA